MDGVSTIALDGIRFNNVVGPVHLMNHYVPIEALRCSIKLLISSPLITRPHLCDIMLYAFVIFHEQLEIFSIRLDIRHDSLSNLIVTISIIPIDKYSHYIKSHSNSYYLIVPQLIS